MSASKFVSPNPPKRYLLVSPRKVPPKVIALDVSLDFARVFEDALREKGYLKHAEILRNWIERIKLQKELMVEGKKYKTKVDSDHIKAGEIVVFAYKNEKGMCICHPPGEPDMQSCALFYPNDLKKEDEE